MDACTNSNVLTILNLVLTAVDVIRVVIPIILIIMGLIDFSKAVISNDEKEQKKSAMAFVRRLGFAALVFAVPWIVEVAMITFGDVFGEEGTLNFTDCLENVKHLNYYKNFEDEKEVNYDEKDEEEANDKEDESLEENEDTDEPDPDKDDVGTIVGQKYKLDENKLKAIARLCYQELGSVEGAAVEAAFMANQFEIAGQNACNKGKDYCGENIDGLYNYARTSGWFANAPYYMDNGYLNDDIYEAVYDVLVMGKRNILPFYINEHDCIKCYNGDWDVVKIVTNGVEITSEEGRLDRNNYIKDSTRIYNRYSQSYYTFYFFPEGFMAPYGYTDSFKAKYDSLMGN